MRLITFTVNGQRCVGAWILDDRYVVDLAKANRLLGSQGPEKFASMQALIEAGPAVWEAARQLTDDPIEEAVRDTKDVRLCAPVPVPIQMRDCLVFEKHLRQARMASTRLRLRNHPKPDAEMARLQESGAFEPPPVWYRQPIYYKQNRFSVIGHEEDVVWPDYAKVLDYELEFGVFVGRTGKNITRDRAHEHIFGYTILNDVSARDAQADEMAGMLGPAKGKDFDTGNVLGPCIVTADELSDPYHLTMIARVNGEEWSRGSTSTMQHSFEDILQHISASETLHAGEFIGSGTVGSGCGLELGRYPQPGDVVELEVEGIGRLRNRFVKP